MVSSGEGSGGQKPEAEKNGKNETPSWALVNGEGKNAYLIIGFSTKGEYRKSIINQEFSCSRYLPNRLFSQRRFQRNYVENNHSDRSLSLYPNNNSNMWSLTWASLVNNLRFLKNLSSISTRIVKQPVQLVSMLRSLPET